MGRANNFWHYFTRFQQYFFKYRTIPSTSACGEIIGIESIWVDNFYTKLVDMWYLSKQESEYTPTNKLWSIPLYESIQAGFPSPATDELKQELRLEEYLIENPTNTIFVKVKGDSMIDACIAEGDAVIVEKGKKSKEGDVVIAVVDNEYTLKYLMKENGKYCLEPANKNYDTIYPDDSLEIFGVVVWVFRKYT